VPGLLRGVKVAFGLPENPPPLLWWWLRLRR